MISTASAPASRAIAVSSSVSSSLAEPVPGTNGTRSAISSAAALIAAARSCVDCADGSPVDPPGAIDPRIRAGSLLNRIVVLLSFGQPGLVSGLPALAQGVQAVDGLALG